MKCLIIYHGNCVDGFTAAWIAESVLSQDQDTKLYAATYPDPPPFDLIDQNTRVYILDFSYSWEDTLAICDTAAFVVVLDHHKSAIEGLQGFKHPKCQLLLDTFKSGAGLAWKWFYPGVDMPDLVARVQDRDLWKFEYEDSKNVNEAIFSRPYSLETWDAMAKMPIADLEKEGEALKRKKDKEVAEFIEKHSKEMVLGNCKVMSCNLPYFYASECGHKLLQDYPDYPFAVTYYLSGNEVIFSLRSDDTKMDVSLIAKRFGGGGHRNAAGFKLPAQKFYDQNGQCLFPSDIEFTEEDIAEEQDELAKGIISNESEE